MNTGHSKQQMLTDAKIQIRASGEFHTANDLAARFGVNVDDLKEKLNAWVARREIFSVDDEDAGYLFPIFAFVGANGLHPRKEVAKVLEAFGVSYSPWFIASWFIAVNSYLDDQVPRDLLEIDPEWVIEAALDQIRESAHE